MSNSCRNIRVGVLLAVALGLACTTRAETLTVDASEPPSAPESGYFKMGTSKSPRGAEVGVNSRALLRNGIPVVPVMGEFHYTRCPETAWRDELLKMKAGGVNIVSTYVFWIHHEELEGKWDWAGRRNLRKFVETARDVGLDVVVRLGPWCHGEVRNGGFPDWLLAKGWKLRTDDPKYLEAVRRLYGQIAAQLQGLLWKDGGPVIAMQIENEFHGEPEHLLTLKKLARDAGLDAPIYTYTGWPTLKKPLPTGELLPLYGAYAEGFWDRQLTSMPGDYWSKFHFSSVRTDAAIATDIFGAGKTRDPADTDKYPYLTCEIGGGMATSYHRRILIDPRDVTAVTLIKVGSGGNLPGYYMYHGGTNPTGQATTLQESQATGMANDLPEKGYDFQAPLGEFGQVRPQFHDLRLLHLFLHDFGTRFAGMTPRLPETRPGGKDDLHTLRWAVRSDGASGMLFVNNYERSREMSAHEAVQFRVKLGATPVTVPSKTFIVPANSVFFWPLNLDLGGVKLVHATAQPICQLTSEGKTYTFFAETKGVSAEFAFDSDVATTAAKATRDGLTVVTAQPGTGAAITVRDQVIVLLDAETARHCYKANWLGKDRVFLSAAVVVPDGSALRLMTDDATDTDLRMFPAPEKLRADGQEIMGSADGVFRRFAVFAPALVPPRPEALAIRAAGPPREIPMGPGKKPVAIAPTDADFAQAGVWRMKLPATLDRSHDYLLRVRYAGDVARAYLGNELLTDDFYNGSPFDLGLRTFAPTVFEKELFLKILPLRKDAPIFLADRATPDFHGQEAIAEIVSVELIERREARLTASN